MLPHAADAQASGRGVAGPRAGAGAEGLTEQLDSWHVSSLPEEKTFFGMDVSLEVVEGRGGGGVMTFSLPPGQSPGRRGDSDQGPPGRARQQHPEGLAADRVSR